MLTRRSLLALAAAYASLTVPESAWAAGAAKVLRIGWQRNGVLALVKQRGTLEKRLAPDGITVAWSEFPSGPPLVEALGSGAIDIGTTGDVPPIFAQAGRSDLVYVAAGPLPGSQCAILVKKDSPIKTLADLKGKTLGFLRGSWGHNVAVSLLATVGLTLKDVTVANLSPADAGAAFASGSIDAWSIWDPYFAIAEQNPDTRVLATAAGVADTNNFLLANGAYAKDNAATLRAVIAALAEDAAWSQDHLDDSIKSIAEITGVSEAAVRMSFTRPNVHFAISPITDDMMRVQQKTADAFYNAGLIPKKLDVRALVWKPTPS